MKTNGLIAILLGFSSIAFGYEVNFQIVKVNSVVKASDEQKAKEGINYFSEIVKRDCKIDLRSKIETKSKVSDSVKFNYTPSWEKHNNFSYRYFQKSIYDYTTKNNLSQPSNGVSLLMLGELPSRCGFAIPDVQLLDEASKLQNPNSSINDKIIPWIRNRVLLAPSSVSDIECGSASRLVAHELAHIFIQDNPPHQCEDEDTHTMKTCAENSILSVRRAVYKNGNGGIGFGGPPKKSHPGYGMGDEPDYLPAIGNFISPAQCKAIEVTLRGMQP